MSSFKKHNYINTLNQQNLLYKIYKQKEFEEQVQIDFNNIMLKGEKFKQIDNNSKKNFLFSSVGDNTKFDSLWVNDNMDYDIYVIYYGDNDEIYSSYKSKVKFIEKRKGSKYQNFKYFYDKYINIINTYDRYFILDDDIIFNVDDINNMFKLSKKYNLDICSPSFTRTSKISHKITKHKKNILLSYTNFVEVGCALFNKQALHKLMLRLDYNLIAYGIDYLYIMCNGSQKKKSYAIIHKIVCENPRDNKKKNGREFKKVKNALYDKRFWFEFAKKNNIATSFITLEYSNIPL